MTRKKKPGVRLTRGPARSEVEKADELYAIALQTLEESTREDVRNDTVRSTAEVLRGLWLARKMSDASARRFLRTAEKLAFDYFVTTKRSLVDGGSKVDLLLRFAVPHRPKMNEGAAVGGFIERVQAALEFRSASTPPKKIEALAPVVHGALAACLPGLDPRAFRPTDCGSDACTTCVAIAKRLRTAWLDGKGTPDEMARAALRAVTTAIRARDLVKVGLSDLESRPVNMRVTTK